MFSRKNKKYYFAKKWGCHGTPDTPGVDGPDTPFFKTTPSNLPTLPFLGEKSEPSLFFENFEKLKTPLYKGGEVKLR